MFGRLELIGVDPVVNHADLRTPVLWKAAALEVCWGDAPTAAFQVQQGIGGFEMQPGGAWPFGCGLQFRVEMGIKAVRLVEEFLVREQGHIGPDIREAEHFAPAGMAANQIGVEPFGFEFCGCFGAGFPAQNLALQIQGPGVNVFGISPLQSVLDVSEGVGQDIGGWPEAKPNQFMAFLGKRLKDVNVLARKALMDKQQFEFFGSRKGHRCCCWYW